PGPAAQPSRHDAGPVPARPSDQRSQASPAGNPDAPEGDRGRTRFRRPGFPPPLLYRNGRKNPSAISPSGVAERLNLVHPSRHASTSKPPPAGNPLVTFPPIPHSQVYPMPFQSTIKGPAKSKPEP